MLNKFVQKHKVLVKLSISHNVEKSKVESRSGLAIILSNFATF